MDESKSMTATEEVGESFAQSSEDAGYFEGGLGANEVGAGPLFNDSVDGSELLGIGFVLPAAPGACICASHCKILTKRCFEQ